MSDETIKHRMTAAERTWRALHAKGMTAKQAAEVLGTKVSAPYNAAERYGFDWTRKPRKERIPKLPRDNLAATRERNLAIVDAFRAGETLTAIGVRHGMTRERVRQIVAGFGETSALQQKRNAALAAAAEIGVGQKTIDEAKAIAAKHGVAYSTARKAGGRINHRHVYDRRKNDIEAALARVVAGESVTSVTQGDHSLRGLVQAEMAARGIKSKAKSRWSVDPARRKDAIKNAAILRMTRDELLEYVSAIEGTNRGLWEPLCVWAARHGVDMSYWVEKRAKRVEKPKRIEKPQREAQPPRQAPVINGEAFPTVRDAAIALRGKATASQIAEALGVTRNSIIGHWYRARQHGSVA